MLSTTPTHTSSSPSPSTKTKPSPRNNSTSNSPQNKTKTSGTGHFTAVLWAEKWPKSKNYLKLSFQLRMSWKSKKPKIKNKTKSMKSMTTTPLSISCLDQESPAGPLPPIVSHPPFKITKTSTCSQTDPSTWT
jgi:hypothetical protein